MEREDTQVYTPDSLIRDLIVDNNLLLMAISRFDIAFGFGDCTVKKACQQNGVDVNTFLAVCNLLSCHDVDASTISLPTLMDYLKRTHDSFVNLTFPKIRHHLIEAVNYTGSDGSDDVSLQLIRFYDNYVEEVKQHMDYENHTIFSYVEKMLDGKIDPLFRLSHFSGNHGHMATKLNELKDVFIYHYNRRENARISATLFDIIQCEHDLMSHFEVESKLFIPEAIRLESRLQAQIADPEPSASDTFSSDPLVNLLGEREKEIVRCVAKGMSNKAIADELCLSVHTITTHRRNISAKLDIHSAAGLTIFAILHHLVDLKDVNPIH